MPFRQQQQGFTPWLSIATQALQGRQQGQADQYERDQTERAYTDQQAQRTAAAQAADEERRYRRSQDRLQTERQNGLDLSREYDRGMVPQEQVQAAAQQELAQPPVAAWDDPLGVAGNTRIAAQMDMQTQSPYSIAGKALVKGRQSDADRVREDQQKQAADMLKAKQETDLAIATQALQGKTEAQNRDIQARKEIAQMNNAARADLRSAVQPQLKPIPQSAMKAMITNDVALSRINKAITSLESDPKSVGQSNAFGGAWLKDNVFTKSKDDMGTRAAIADIGSQIIHDRSGAAVTVSEYPRLAPFIPSVTDPTEKAQAKLAHLQALIQEEADLYRANYGPDQGYREYQGANQRPAAPANPTRFPSSANPMAGKRSSSIQDY